LRPVVPPVWKPEPQASWAPLSQVSPLVLPLAWQPEARASLALLPQVSPLVVRLAPLAWLVLLRAWPALQVSSPVVRLAPLPKQASPLPVLKV
jgi:hypothetical protein